MNSLFDKNQMPSFIQCLPHRFILSPLLKQNIFLNIDALLMYPSIYKFFYTFFFTLAHNSQHKDIVLRFIWQTMLIKNFIANLPKKF